MRLVCNVLDNQTTGYYNIIPSNEIIVKFSENLKSVTLIQTYKTCTYNNPLHG